LWRIRVGLRRSRVLLCPSFLWSVGGRNIHRAGCAGISKPFSLRELLARVRALLRHEREHHLAEARLGSELEMAAQVQQGLFPHVLPEAPGLDYAGTCRPARVGDGRLGLLLADASGKGMSAAILGAALHSAVRANACGAGDRCGEVLAKASHLLYETTTAEAVRDHILRRIRPLRSGF